MKDVGYYNGKTDLIENMTVPMNDRAMYFGDGVYDVTYAAHCKIYEPEFHIDRFFNSCKLLKMPFKMTKDVLFTELQKCVDMMDSSGEVMIYWSCTRGTGMRNHLFPADGSPANLLIFVKEAHLTDLRKPIKVITVEDTRFYHCNIKTLNLIPSVMAAQAAFEAGCQEAIFHRGDRVTECAHSNVHILKNGILHTAPLDNLILPGTARRHILQLCDKLGIPYVERPFTLKELFNADEIIVTSTGTLGVPVCEIDGKKTGGKDGELLYRIQKAQLDDFEKETGFRPDILD